jgi:hypothetical protein
MTMGKSVVVRIAMFVAAAMSTGSLSTALASGDSGASNVAQIHIEGTSFAAIYSSGSAFANPDNQKLAMALTAISQGWKVDFWVSGCMSTPWGYTIPVVYAMNIAPP